MEDKDQVIRDLHEKIADLARKQKGFQEEIQRLQNAIFELDLGGRTRQTPVVKTVTEPVPPPVIKTPVPPSKPEDYIVKEVAPAPPPRPSVPKTPTAWEEFIGTNLLNKIGIAILVIGVGFGVKYSIDHELMGPITRIILGYVSAIALIVIAIRLKKAHANFSAVLLSGGMAILYFITYAAYDFYALIPQTMAFILMVMFTAFTVFAATQYNMEVIGIIGLVGAYAVPFLLSNGSGQVVILFSYVAIINVGILVLSFQKYWKRLYYTSFILTWLIFGAWHIERYHADEHLTKSLLFSSVYFLIFYTTFLAYKLIKREQLSRLDLFLMLSNSFVFYGFGYASIDAAVDGEKFLGLFTVATAVIHFIACVIIYRQQSQFKDIFYFVAGMVLVFLTLAVPVQLEGNWVTLVWAGEAFLMFWIGRTKQFPVYEKMSYVLIVLAFGSLVQDWQTMYVIDRYYPKELATLRFFLNIQFASSLLVAAAFFAIMSVSRNQKFKAPWEGNTSAEQLFHYGLPALVGIVVYCAFFLEIQYFWTKLYLTTGVSVGGEDGGYTQNDDNLLSFRSVWLIIYSSIFAIVISVVQMRFIKSRAAMIVSLALNAFVIFMFLTIGLYELSVLRTSYLTDQDNAYFIRDSGHILIRYLAIAITLPLLFINYRYLRDKWFSEQMRNTEQVLMHLALLVLLSSELVHWLEMSGIHNSFKLALSILWGSYGLLLIVLGLRSSKKHLRVSAMVLFGVTLIKLFVYDMPDMSTIAKTIVMIVLGILLLVSSFLYNRSRKSTTNETP